MGGIDKSCLPAAAREVADVIGIGNTVRLMMEYPPIVRDGKRGRETSGRYIHIPKKPNGGKLEKLLGRVCLQKLIDLYGGDRIYISNGREFLINYKLKCMQELRDIGFSASVIAGLFKVSERYVFKVTRNGGKSGQH